MKAMVMAAGAGTRLHPLTHSVPKPMVPVANRPVLEYTLDNLRRHAITDLILNLHSHPQLIKNYFKNGKKWGVNIHYSHEPNLLGTAGGVKNVASFLKGGTFLVMSGDGLTDIDLTALLDFHRKNKSQATMALKPVDMRFEYGVTLTDRSGRIKRFMEKPQWSDVFSNQVNTGIYVFESSILTKIPAKKVFDFGHDLWPALLSSRARIFGFPLKGYWCDVGNLNEYRRAQRDMLDGKVDLPFHGRMIRPRIWVDDGAQIDPSVKLEAPCLIGKNARIGKGTHIGAYTVIGNNARIGRRASLRNCVLWDNVRVHDHVSLQNCVLGHNTHVTESISVYEGVLIETG